MPNQILELKDFPYVIDRKVAWSDVDSFQHVNSVQYLRYFEDIRAEYLYKIGIKETLKKSNIGIVVGSITAKYLSPMSYPDTAITGIRVASIEEKKFLLTYIIVSKESGLKVVEGETLIFAYDISKGKSTAIPETWLHLMKEIQPDLCLK